MLNKTNEVFILVCEECNYYIPKMGRLELGKKMYESNCDMLYYGFKNENCQLGSWDVCAFRTVWVRVPVYCCHVVLWITFVIQCNACSASFVHHCCVQFRVLFTLLNADVSRREGTEVCLLLFNLEWRCSGGGFSLLSLFCFHSACFVQNRHFLLHMGEK